MPRHNRQGAIFDRLVPDAAPYHGLSCHEQNAQCIAAIKSHLERLLNTRRGCSQSSPDMGLSDFNGHLGGIDLMARIGTDIRHAVNTYEPRLHILRMHFVTDPDAPLQLNIRMDCQVHSGVLDEKLQVDLLINHARTQVK